MDTTKRLAIEDLPMNAPIEVREAAGYLAALFGLDEDVMFRALLKLQFDRLIPSEGLRVRFVPTTGENSGISVDIAFSTEGHRRDRAILSLAVVGTESEKHLKVTEVSYIPLHG